MCCRCVRYMLCIYMLQMYCVQGEGWSYYMQRKTMTVVMRDRCGQRINVPDDIDDLRLEMVFSPDFKLKGGECQVYIYSRAFDFVDQTFNFEGSSLEQDLKIGVSKLMGNSCIAFGRLTRNSKILPADEDAPTRVCPGDYFRTSGGLPVVSSYAVPFRAERLDFTEIECNKQLTILRTSGPLFLRYKHGKYGPVNCRFEITNLNTPFDRLALQVLAYSETNGFCLKTKRIGGKSGMTFCEDNPPEVHKTYVSPVDYQYFAITISGNGSAFVSYSLLLYTFHEGACYDNVCGNGRCLPQNYICRSFNPCGDFTECPNKEKKMFVHLAIFCATLTGILFLLECVCHLCPRSPSDENDMICQDTPRAQTILEPETLPRVDESAPVQPSAQVQPSAPAPEELLAPDNATSELPPSYDEVMARPETYGCSLSTTALSTTTPSLQRRLTLSSEQHVSR